MKKIEHSKEEVLVVDDAKNILDLAHLILSAEGYRVSLASNGLAALKVMEQKSFHVLLTDIRMPGMSGLELIKLSRSVQPEIISVVITGHGTVTTAIESLKLGAMGFILKPFTHQELLSVVHHVTEKKRLAGENLRLRSLMPLFEVNRRLLSETDPDALLQRVVEIVQEETGARRVSLMILDSSGTELATKASVGIPFKATRNRIKLNNGVLGKVVAEGKPMLARGETAKSPDWQEFLEDKEATSALSLPLIHRKKPIGVLTLSNGDRGSSFSESDLELTSILCGQASVAIENARLYQAIQKTHIRTLLSLVAAIEIKDLFSKGHSSNIARYATLIGQKVGLSNPQLRDLVVASILHDIGKIGCSDGILSKPEKLAPEECREMETHPEKAITILAPIGLSDSILSGIRHHHERWDGSGYPKRLEKEAIPFYSRLIAIADALDNLISDQPYRLAVSFDEARQEIVSGKGRQFDPQLIDLFSRFKESDFLEPSTMPDLLMQ